MNLIKWINFQSHEDYRGQLVSLEIGRERTVPFDVKRVYYIHKTGPDVSRGFHAHKNLKQIVTCVAGNCRMVLDNGKSRQSVKINDPTKGLLIESMVWREMHDFSNDCILIILASDHYDESDYIRDYHQFVEQVCQ
ncbi:FdtA/QdtA family cupin domain-containing protein [Halomonas daqingensis]|uniref:FdtA/QdtA family cupin domain-containing protein n=1 Tax=Billgrantia desiderata TaxID=52021 RepID=A0ABS9B0D3_9GAMM|nr:FdtA/QdtA family cupin domain-containing protein [Halomonas desiderata]MCE8040561.1 FdtA/QdtA family cupin domain-containing protein [Halomonas desiderata]MCE8045136.1 FdtA/QdtA family cupin domain-containing protein [Halomonas desiderata]